MSRSIEDKAKDYLINKLRHSQYRFVEKEPSETGFDLWMEDVSAKERRKIELKASDGTYTKRSDIFQQLYFSAKNEAESFESGETRIIRIFLGNSTPKVFVIDKSILENGARFESEYRAKIVGNKNYQGVKEL